MTATDRVIRGCAVATVAVLAGVAGAISYSHMEELARLHGEVGWRAHAFPVSVDGIEIVASLVLLAHRRAGTRAGWLPWAALLTGTGASVAANVAVGAGDVVGRLVAGWPAVALLVSIKLLSGLVDAAPGHRAAPPSRRPVPGSETDIAPDAPGAGGAVPGAAHGGVEAPHPVPGTLGRRVGAGRRRELVAGSRDDVPAELLEQARAIRDRLGASGTPVTGRAVAAELRRGGCRVGNDRIAALMRHLTMPTSHPRPAENTRNGRPGGGDVGRAGDRDA